MSDIFYHSTQQTKKILDKLKKCCSIISKYNLSSPCLLQFVRDTKGEYQVIISHNPLNNGGFDIYKLFQYVTCDEFEITPEDEKYFITEDIYRNSVPIIVSSFPIEYPNTNEDPALFTQAKYAYSTNSFYIFPKFVLEALKEEIIEDFEVCNRSVNNGTHPEFSINIKFQPQPRYIGTLFINSNPRIDRYLNERIFPIEHNENLVSSCVRNASEKNPNLVAYMKMNYNEWEKYLETYKKPTDSAVKIKTYNDHEMVIYCVDFVIGKFETIECFKEYQGKTNIVILNIKISMKSGYTIVFKYKYYEL